MNRKVAPGLWKLFVPGRGTVWMAAWAGETRQTFHEQFARHWLEQRQSQFVIVEATTDEYPEADSVNPL